MFRAIHIDTLELEPLQPYRTLRRSPEHRRQGVFVAEGEKVVRRLLESDLPIRSLLLSPDWLEKLRGDLNARPGGVIEVFVMEHRLMEQIIGFRFHQGVMALAEVPAEPHISSLPSPHVLVALDSLHHADNVGVIARNAAALGVDAMIVGERSASPYLRRSVRNSMGAVFRLPIVHPPSLGVMLRSLAARRGTRLIAADASGDTSLEEADFSGNVCVILGNEQDGVGDEILSLCSLRVRITMDKGVDSLNVGSAAAVIFHAMREYRRRPGKAGRPQHRHL